MADIKDIVSEQNYTGNAALGGGTSGVISIDVKPVEELARFTMMANKADYDQRQKDVDAKIANLALYTALDLNGTRAKDKEYLLGKYSEVNKIAEEYARYQPKDQDDKVRKELEYKKKVAELGFDINSGNKRALAYQVRLNAINTSSDDGATKADKLKKLNEQFDSTDITTPIPAEENYSIEIPKIGAPVYSTNEATQKDANGFLTSTFKLFAPRENNTASFAESQGLVIAPLPANATEFEKQEYEAKQRAYKKAGHTLYQDAATAFNDALNDPKYKDASGNVNYDQMKADNPLLASTVKLIDDWNNYSVTRKKQMESGAFLDRTGSKPLASLINPNDYFTIDKKQPLTAQNLIFLQKFKDAVPDGKQEKYSYTGEDISKKKLGVEWYDAATKRMAANKENKTVAAPVIERPAILLGKHIQTLKDWFIRNPKETALDVQYGALDENTRSATGIKEGQYIQYGNNGSYKIIDKKTGQTAGAGTIENIAQGFIDAVKTIQIGETKDGNTSESEGFQVKSEAALNQIYGTNKGQAIWDNWGSEKQAVPSGSNIPAYTKEDLLNSNGGWTEDRINAAVSAGKIKLK